jgi:hypothetical protein
MWHHSIILGQCFPACPWILLCIVPFNYYIFVGFEVLTAVVMKRTVFWDITTCNPLKVNRRFGGTYRLYVQGRRIRRARNLLSRRYFAPLILRPWRWRRYDPPKCRLTFNGLHGVISQTIVLYYNLIFFFRKPTATAFLVQRTFVIPFQCCSFRPVTWQSQFNKLKSSILWYISSCNPVKVTALRGVTSQKAVPFIVAAMRTSNPIHFNKLFPWLITGICSRTLLAATGHCLWTINFTDVGPWD